jgi:transcriptional regulator with XRE-family HTH domain
MYMARTDENVFGETLDRFRKSQGLTQSDLSRKLGIGQPHLSRLIAGGAMPSDKLRFRAEKLMTSIPRQRKDEWTDKVAEAAARSPDFKRLVNSALEIVRRHGKK